MSELDELVRRCQQGELVAFTDLFRRYESQVYRLAVTILRDEEDAEDAMQDTFLRVFERIKSFRGESSLKTWLTAVAVNRCRDKWIGWMENIACPSSSTITRTCHAARWPACWACASARSTRG